MTTAHTASTRTQQGAALAVSLILLLVMTIVGVAAMNGARMEINMAGLIQEEQEALHRSERALSDAESEVESLVATQGLFEFTSDEDEEDGLYGPDANLGVQVDSEWTGVDWTGVDAMKGPTYTDNNKDDDDEVVIQYLGSEIIPGEHRGEDGEAGIVGRDAHVYRITTRSAIGSKSVRVIESTYTTEEAP